MPGMQEGYQGCEAASVQEMRRMPARNKNGSATDGPGFVVQQQERVPSKEKCKDEVAELIGVIERGMPSGEKIVFERMSEQTPGMIPGDIVVELQQRPHDRFERRGNDLHTKMRVTLKEALTGFKKTINHLDGHTVGVQTNPYERSNDIIRPGLVKTFRKEGMPVHETPSMFGNMKVEFVLDFPKQLNPEQRSVIERVLG